MGESDTGSGGQHFKRYFGATPVEYAAVRLERLPLSATEQRARSAYAALSAARRRLQAHLSARRGRAVSVPAPSRGQAGSA
jgi:hypothetical protein